MRWTAAVPSREKIWRVKRSMRRAGRNGLRRQRRRLLCGLLLDPAAHFFPNPLALEITRLAQLRHAGTRKLGRTWAEPRLAVARVNINRLVGRDPHAGYSLV